MDEEVKESLFTVKTTTYTKPTGDNPYIISVHLIVDPAFKSYLDSKPYHKIETIGILLPDYLPYIFSDMVRIVFTASTENAKELKYPLEKALKGNLELEVNSLKEQIALEQEIKRGIQSYFQKQIQIYYEKNITSYQTSNNVSK